MGTASLKAVVVLGMVVRSAYANPISIVNFEELKRLTSSNQKVSDQEYPVTVGVS